jgi:hypothetical protein
VVAAHKIPDDRPAWIRFKFADRCSEKPLVYKPSQNSSGAFAGVNPRRFYRHFTSDDYCSGAILVDSTAFFVTNIWHQADTSLYQAKHHGRDPAVLFAGWSY